MRRAGFTLFEIVIVVGIIVVVFAATVPYGIGFYRSHTLTAERDNLTALLRRARSAALTNVRERPHGIRINADEYVLFEGTSYAARVSAYDEPVPRAGGFTMGGPTEIIFYADGSTNSSGSITLSEGAGTSTISVNYEGQIDW